MVDDVAARVVAKLVQCGCTVGTVESLTAGLIAASVADVPGASRVLKAGLVTYQTASKIELAQVPADVVATHGVVSAQTAAAMAEQGRRLLDVTVVLSCTGVAGPDLVENRAAGTVFLGLATAQGVQTRELQLAGSRLEIRQRTVSAALEWLEETLVHCVDAVGEDSGPE